MSTYLCQAWGETDLPVACIVSRRDEIQSFIVREWFGSEDDPELPTVMAEFDAHDWKDGPLEWEFEIGGVRISQVYVSVEPAKEPSAEAVAWPHPDHAQHIVFEGCDCIVLAPEEYEAIHTALQAAEERARKAEQELQAHDELSWQKAKEQGRREAFERAERAVAKSNAIAWSDLPGSIKDQATISRCNAYEFGSNFAIIAAVQALRAESTSTGQEKKA